MRYVPDNAKLHNTRNRLRALQVTILIYHEDDAWKKCIRAIE